MGLGEIAERLAIGKDRAYRVTRRPDFPEPCARITAGRVWRTPDVEQWIREHRPEVAIPAQRHQRTFCPRTRSSPPPSR